MNISNTNQGRFLRLNVSNTRGSRTINAKIQRVTPQYLIVQDVKRNKVVKVKKTSVV